MEATSIEFRFELSCPMKLICKTQATLCIASNQYTKHMKVDNNFVQERFLNDVIETKI